MTVGFTALIFAAGISAWVYSKMRHRTNSGQTSVIIGAVVGIIAFIVFYTAFSTFVK